MNANVAVIVVGFLCEIIACLGDCGDEDLIGGLIGLCVRQKGSDDWLYGFYLTKRASMKPQGRLKISTKSLIQEKTRRN